ncbi:hypothetical protein NIES806_20300 [Dolichospermum compactum NIES-806]|uniref:Uncharacterized protein n=2 Tax=Dolichospermum compactum TaxID=136073 RepID=A0A1Z4V2S9_9CYAN|nr:hypothetical protein NIES806_20300 [Dolichospermum compactum NIES-806]
MSLISSIGRIVVNSDECTLNNTGFQQSPDADKFAINVAKYFVGEGKGKFHALSNHFGLVESSLEKTLTQAGHTWSKGTNITIDLPTLSKYDGIFLAGNPVNNQVLIQYVKNGGKVYLAAGTGLGGSQAEADRWNTFLGEFGLKFAGLYNGIVRNLSPNQSHPLFAGVKSLYFNSGNSITDLKPESSLNQIIQTHISGQGLIATAEFNPTGLLSTGNKIKLKSWKGDYLHRPDSDQGVTSWNTGVGNEWTVEVIADNKIKLKSWKGDYLHRPDSDQGVTTWHTGVGNEWTVEAIAGIKIKLKSWKGDYLHRPDSQQGVTSWSTGVGNEWEVELV